MDPRLNESKWRRCGATATRNAAAATDSPLPGGSLVVNLLKHAVCARRVLLLLRVLRPHLREMLLLLLGLLLHLPRVDVSICLALFLECLHLLWWVTCAVHAQAWVRQIDARQRAG